MAKAVKTVNDFRAAHDRNVIVPAKIKAALEAMLKEGAENWNYESDFIKLAGVGQNDLSEYREQFAAHIVQTGAMHGRAGRRVWFADPKVAKRVRGE